MKIEIEEYGKIMEGYFKIDSIKDGEIVDTYEEHNKIMVTARTAMARNMSGKVNATSPINRFILGDMGWKETILDPKEFIDTRTKLFAESHQVYKNITDLGLTFDGFDTITNPTAGSVALKHAKTYRLTMDSAATKEFRKIEDVLIAPGTSYVINSNDYETIDQSTKFVDVVIDLGFLFDGVGILTNSNNYPVTLANDIVYLVTLTNGDIKEFTKLGNSIIPKDGGLYDIQFNTLEPYRDTRFGHTFSVDFDSTDYTLMTHPTIHETIILAADGETKSHKIEAIQSYEGLPIAPISSGVNINVIAEGNKVTYKVTIPQTQGNDIGGGVVAYTEAALYCDDQIFSMKTFPARTKDSSLEYVITWVITY